MSIEPEASQTQLPAAVDEQSPQSAASDLERRHPAPTPDKKSPRIRSGLRAGSGGSDPKLPPSFGVPALQRSFGGPKLPRSARRS